MFIHWDEMRAHRAVSKLWISSPLSEAIHLAYWTLDRELQILCASPYSVRGIADSWAKIEFQPRKSVVWLPGWPRVPLPNTSVWTLLVVLLGPRSWRLLHVPAQGKAKLNTVFFPPRPLSLAFAIRLGPMVFVLQLYLEHVWGALMGC